MGDEILDWTVDGVALRIGATRRGAGPLALLLPALSSISTRAEMAPLAERLSHRFTTLAVDWPGFGDMARPARGWSRGDMARWLDHLRAVVAPSPALVVAAGHAAGYLLLRAASRPDDIGHAALVSPTWRGPLPTMLGRRPAWLGAVRAAVDAPGLGPLLYRLNLSGPVISRMARGHVYGDPLWLTPERLAAKQALSRVPGARSASVRFVTGALDPCEEAGPVRTAAAVLRDRLTLLWGDATPAKSRAEMEALAAASGLTPTLIPKAKLGAHEEHPDACAAAILRGLDARGGAG